MKRLIFWWYPYFKETFIYKYIYIFIYIYNWRYSICNWGGNWIEHAYKPLLSKWGLGHIVGAIPNKIAVAVCSCSIRTKFITGQHVYGGCGGFVTKAWMCIHRWVGWMGKNLWKIVLQTADFPFHIPQRNRLRNSETPCWVLPAEHQAQPSTERCAIGSSQSYNGLGIWKIWQCVKTLVPSEPQNSW